MVASQEMLVGSGDYTCVRDFGSDMKTVTSLYVKKDRISVSSPLLLGYRVLLQRLLLCYAIHFV